MKSIVKDLSRKSVADLEKEIIQAHLDMNKSRLEIVSNPAKDVNMMSKKRKHIAQLMTVRKEKQLYELSQKTK